jgi:integrase
MGKGSISQRQDGRWTARVDLGYVNGKRKRKQIYGKTRKEVAEQLKVLLRDQQQGLELDVQRQTVAHFLTRWLTDVVEPSTRPATFRVYAYIVRSHLIPQIGHHQLAKLTPQQVQAMLRRKREAGLSPATVQRVRDVLRNALTHALKWGLIVRNVAMLVEPPKVERRQLNPLTYAQAQRLLAAAKGDRYDALYRVALSLGLREGEVLGLRWEDIDLNDQRLHVRVAVQLVHGKPTLVQPKTARSQRTLPLPATLVTVLKEHHVRQLEQRLLAGSRWQETGLVFTSNLGTPIYPRNLLRSFYKLVERAGLPRMRFHDLRHSCATFLATQGVPARVAMEILGHSDIRLTLGVYTHVLDESKRDAAAVMDKLFGAVEEAN